MGTLARLDELDYFISQPPMASTESPSANLGGFLGPGQVEHTQTPATTPRKDFRIAESKGRVNEKERPARQLMEGKRGPLRGYDPNCPARRTISTK